MVQHTGKPVIDFTRYITERTTDFTGREWVFQAINDWLADSSGSRFFLLTGEPGSGKTAIASQLAQFSHGVVTPLASLTHLTSGFLSALHFCSALDSRWINPYIFAESLALQLAERFPTYAKDLAEKGGDRQVRIEVQQRIEQGQAVGVLINRLDISGVSPEDAFNRVVREPLEVLLRSGFDQQVVILVDALDEALGYSSPVNIVSLLTHLDELPSRVRFLLTSRQDSRIEHAFLNADELMLSATKYEQYNQNDIRRYIHHRFSNQQLAEKVTQLEPSLLTQEVETVLRKAEGNFLYVHFLIDAIARGQRLLTELEGLPEGLDKLYFESLKRVVKQGEGHWHEEYAPLLGMLSVAQESPTLAQLQSFIQQPLTIVLKQLDDLWQFIEEVKLPTTGEACYRLYHQSVIDFLHCQALVTKEKVIRNTFYLAAEEQHKALVDWCERDNLATIWEDTTLNQGEQGRREYARRYYITHLYQAREWPRLFAVLDEGAYGRTKVQRFDYSTRSYAQDLDLGRQAAAWEGWSLEKGVILLPRLWRYSLLRCSLTSRALQYPLALFELLLLLGRKSEILGMAEILPDSSYKLRVLLQIAEQLANQAEGKQSSMQIFSMALNVVNRRVNSREKANALNELATALAKTEQWEWAKAVYAKAEELAYLIDDTKQKDITLRELAESLAKIGQWEHAEELAFSIKDNNQKSYALRALAIALAEVGLSHQMQDVFNKTEELAFSIEDNNQKSRALDDLAIALAEVGDWKRAEEVACAITDSIIRTRTLHMLSRKLAEAERWEWAKAVYAKAEEASHTIVIGDTDEEYELVEMKLSDLAITLAYTRQWERAENVAKMIKNSYSYGPTALSKLAFTLAKDRQWKRAEEVANMIEDSNSRTDALIRLATILVESGQGEQANSVWRGLVHVIIKRSIWTDQFLSELALALAKAKQWKQAKEVADAITKSTKRAEALSKIAIALAKDGQWKRAEKMGAEAEVMARRIEDSQKWPQIMSELAFVLAKARLWKQAEVVANAIADSEEKAEALIRLAVIFAKSGKEKQAYGVWNQAEEAVHAIKEDSFRRDLKLEELAIALAEVGQLKHAEETAYSIEHKAPKSRALEELALALGKVRQLKHAEEVARTIENCEWRAEALIRLATVLAESGQGEQAYGVWKRSEGESGAIKFKFGKIQILSELALAFAKAGQLKYAEEVITAIADSEERAEALIKLAIKLAESEHGEQAYEVCRQAEKDVNAFKYWFQRDKKLCELTLVFAKVGQLKHAEKIANTIEDSRERIIALINLAIVFAESGQAERAYDLWEQEEEIVRAIKEDSSQRDEKLSEPQISVAKMEFDWRDQKLCELAIALAKAGQLKHAEEVITAIADSEERAEALIKLAIVLAESGQRKRVQDMCKQAEEVVGTIEYSSRRDEKLCELGISLAKGHVWTEAEHMISMIESNKQTEALQGLVLALAQAQEWARLLRIVQHSWRREERREDLLSLLPLAYGLMDLKPEIGITFFEAFTWVDDFLSYIPQSGAERPVN